MGANNNFCVLCDSSGECSNYEVGDYFRVSCSHYHDLIPPFNVHEEIILDANIERREKLLILILEWMLKKPYCRNQKLLWHFYYQPDNTANDYYPENEQYINMAPLLVCYPQTLQEQTDRALMNLSRVYPNFGDKICLAPFQYRLIFQYSANNCNSAGLLSLMVDLGFLNTEDHSVFNISAKGWQHIYELQKKNQTEKQGFIAMSFRPETQPIRDAFRKAIYAAGYNPMVIDEKEHNNQIVPEIFYEIDKSLFVVVDVTYPNCGAYYEAGYALGKGKEVIFCCREKEFKEPDTRPHFDIAQKSMIIWKTEEELTERLTKRIKITVDSRN